MANYEFTLKLVAWGDNVDDAFQNAVERFMECPTLVMDRDVEYEEIYLSSNLVEYAESLPPAGGVEH